MVECRELRLHIGSGSHFLRGADQHPRLTGAHLAKQLFLLRLRVCRVDIGNFLCRNALGNQLVSEIIIDIELAITVGRRQVAEDTFCLMVRLENISALRRKLPSSSSTSSEASRQ